MKVYDPRLDTSPGANPTDRRYFVETRNPALLAVPFLDLCEGDSIDWRRVAELADRCDQKLPFPLPMRPVVYGVVGVGEDLARETLAPWIQDGSHHMHEVDDLYALAPESDLVEWRASPDEFNPDTHARAYLDGRFTWEQLAAIAWWMRNKARPVK